MNHRQGTELPNPDQGPVLAPMPGGLPSTPRIEVGDGEIRIQSLTVRDPLLVSLLAEDTPETWGDTLCDVLSIGARGLATMGIGLDVSEIDHRVQVSVDRANERSQAEVESLLAEAHQAVTNTLDPARRDSLVARIIDDFDQVRRTLVAEVDPDRKDSHSARLLDGIERYLGPDGELASRLRTALDPTVEGSGLSLLAGTFDRRFTEMRDLIVEDRGRRSEAAAGTRKGLDFEDRLEADLRRAAKSIGALVERTSTTAGGLSTSSKVGDYLVELEGGIRIVVEAKNSRAIGLLGADGMLAELDRGMVNREADLAICVSSQDAYPAEVGCFGIFGNRLLIVDDGDGVLIDIALRWARTWAGARNTGAEQIDLAAVNERLGRIRHVAQLFSSNKRTLTDIAGNVDRVRTSLDSMRSDLLEMTDDLDRLLRPALTGGEVVKKPRLVG